MTQVHGQVVGVFLCDEGREATTLIHVLTRDERAAGTQREFNISDYYLNGWPPISVGQEISGTTRFYGKRYFEGPHVSEIQIGYITHTTTTEACLVDRLYL